MVLGFIIIEVASKKKPWYYNFSDNKAFLKFLGTSYLTPTIPKKLSI